MIAIIKYDDDDVTFIDHCRQSAGVFIRRRSKEELRPFYLQHCVGPDVGENQKFERAGGDGVASAKLGEERGKLVANP
jgi:hypothetical protein